jgi:hypothetical protein
MRIELLKSDYVHLKPGGMYQLGTSDIEDKIVRLAFLEYLIDELKHDLAYSGEPVHVKGFGPAIIDLSEKVFAEFSEDVKEGTPQHWEAP